MNQSRIPLYEALCEYRKERIVSFDVPGHKQGKGNPDLKKFLGEDCLSLDVNSMKCLDNLCHPISVIKEAQELCAQAFHATHAFFMVNGTSSAVQAMILSTCRPGDKIIMPRNVHRSAMNALILQGIYPIYINPGIHEGLGISLGMKLNDIKEAIVQHPDAKAILVNNPTYYGICSDLKTIVEMAHEAGMKVLVDEAHGTHFYFGENMPIHAMDAGADMAAVSTHKTGGSLTQSSLLLIGPSMEEGYVRQILNLTQTTSASYLLMASLDITRHFLVMEGKKVYQKVVELADYAREEIGKMEEYVAFSRELINGDDIYDVDPTKLCVHTRGIGLAGKEVYDILRDDFQIQIEFGDIGNMLAIISVGDRMMEVERLISALKEISRLHGRYGKALPMNEYVEPCVEMMPQKAFYSECETLRLQESVSRISAEFIMCYPPGIPLIAPGECISEELIAHIEYARRKGCSLTGTQDSEVKHIKVVKLQ
ncbi:MAG: aminotransferase class I/II-fold pyridoxal phosphate-dependent enzyme [Longicatena sp.]